MPILVNPGVKYSSLENIHIFGLVQGRICNVKDHDCNKRCEMY